MYVDKFLTEINDIKTICYKSIEKDLKKVFENNKYEYEVKIYEVKKHFFNLYYSTEEALSKLKKEIHWLQNKEIIKDCIRSIIKKDRFKIFELIEKNKRLVQVCNNLIESNEDLIISNKKLIQELKILREEKRSN